MALKEIKNRISSVRSTQKITSAMKMVSSAKLRKAQRTIEGASPYEQQLSAMLSNFAGSTNESIMQSPFLVKRDIKRITVVVFSSNSSLCGSFNTNIAKQLINILNLHQNTNGQNISIFSIGKKISRFCKKIGYNPVFENNEIADKPDYQKTSELANKLMESFLNGEADKIILVYHHFKNKAVQVVTTRQFLPFEIAKQDAKTLSVNYIIEPNSQKIIEQLIPYVLRTEIYTALLDSLASEHAARTLAMQTATDNANDLLQELSLQYNKQRQQAITSELLDIVGGSMA
jgi:F-type H+-transporting ATPase subunit gamma